MQQNNEPKHTVNTTKDLRREKVEDLITTKDLIRKKVEGSIINMFNNPTKQAF